MACIDCKFYVPSSTKPIAIHEDGFTLYTSEPVPKSCSKGETETFLRWWNDNGMKRGAEARLDVPKCFERTQTTTIADEMLTLLDRVEKLLAI